MPKWNTQYKTAIGNTAFLPIICTMPTTKKPLKNCKIIVYNFTTCNGGTIINDKEYKSNANEALIFDNEIEHQGFTQTDTQRRIILNIATG